MALHRIVIDFEFPPDGQNVRSDWISYIRNFGEELDGHFLRNREGSIDVAEVDSAIDRLSFTLSDNHHKGSVLILVRKLLTRYRLAHIAQVKFLN
jgi:hypothetical protein